MIYFASDVHLGLKYNNDCTEREQKFVKWLVSIESSCDELFLVGDIFDFWFEWNNVVPKGFVRVLGQLAKMADDGVKIHFFAGNHDKWARDYLTEQIGASVYHEPQMFERQNVKFLVVHGDGLGKSDWVGRTLNKLFNSNSARWIFQRFIHPDAAMRFGKWWSGSNREKRGNIGHSFRFENEPVSIWAKGELEGSYAGLGVDYVVIGHLHTPTIYSVTEAAKLVILGEWIENPIFATMENGKMELHKYE